jgi:hypothetical protein
METQHELSWREQSGGTLDGNVTAERSQLFNSTVDDHFLSQWHMLDAALNNR